MGSYIDPKLTASALGQAAAVLLWTLLATFVERVAQMPAETVVIVTGATGLLLSLPFGYLIPNASSPLPADRRPGEVEPMSADEIAALAQAGREAGGK